MSGATQSKKPVFTSFSKKNLTSPSSESLIPIDFSIPKSPFSTAINTDRRCSKSDLCEKKENMKEKENLNDIMNDSDEVRH